MTVRSAGMRALLAALSFFATGPACAGDGWTFDTLLREAGATHPSIIARQRSQEAARADVAAAEWQRYPTPGIELSTDGKGRHDTVAYVQQPLWSGGRITAGIDAAESRHGAAQEEVAAVRRDVLLRLIDAYAETRRRQAQQKIHRTNVQQHERLLEMIERRVGREVSPRVDRDLARSRLYQAANELSFVTQALANSLTRLSELAGQPVAAVAPTDAPEVSGLPAGRTQALEQAAAVSPVLARLTFERNAAEADVKSERAAFWPKLALRLEHRRADSAGPNLSDQRALITLESQFGAGLSTGSRVDAAVARREALAEERRAALRELETDVADTWHQLTAARLRLDNSRINHESAATVFESYARQYVVGQKSWLDVLNAVRESSQSALAVEDAQAEALRAGLRLRMLTGSLSHHR